MGRPARSAVTRVAALVLLAACATSSSEHEPALVLELGPFDIPAAASHDQSPQPEPVQIEAPFTGWLNGFTIDAVDRSGAPVPLDLLHHLKLMAPDRRDLFHPYMLRLIGAGSETRSADLPAVMGVPVVSGEPILLTAMIHNPHDRAFEGVRIRLSVRARVAGRIPSADVYPFFLHASAPGGNNAFDVPPGRSVHSWEASPAVSGRILALGAHVHRYGTELRFEDLTSGRTLWTARATLDDDGEVVEISRQYFHWRGGIQLRDDHVYRVTVVYDNPTPDTIHDGGMGTLAGVLRPARGSTWPDVNPRDALYVQDLAQELSSGGHHAGGSGHAVPDRHGHDSH